MHAVGMRGVYNSSSWFSCINLEASKGSQFSEMLHNKTSYLLGEEEEEAEEGK